jgi:hypothetical protein
MLTAVSGFSQPPQLEVQLNRSFFKAKDTIHFTAIQPQKKATTATLFLMVEHEEGMIWELRWPMLNGHCAASMILPDSLPEGQYRFRFSVLQNLFTVFGKIKSPSKISKLNTTLFTTAGDLYESETDVNPEGLFTYKNVLFENEATIVFSLQDDNNQSNLNIEISTILDSVIFPGNSQTKDVYIGQTEPDGGLKKLVSKNDDPDIRAQVLEAVTVYSKPSNRGEVFNKKYSTGLFKDMNERTINLLDDSPSSNAVSVLQLIRMHTAGLMITTGLNPIARWRGEIITFYLDEMKVSLMNIEMMPVSDIAIIKIYPPPFFGNSGGAGAAVAVYTKRGGFTNDQYKSAFKVRGYTPLLSQFPLHPDRY